MSQIGFLYEAAPLLVCYTNVLTLKDAQRSFVTLRKVYFPHLAFIICLESHYLQHVT